MSWLVPSLPHMRDGEGCRRLSRPCGRERKMKSIFLLQKNFLPTTLSQITGANLPIPTLWGGVSSLAMTGRGIYKELLVIVIYKFHELADPLPTKWGGVSSLATTGRGIYKELLVIVIYKSHELADPLPTKWGGVSSLATTGRGI